MIKKLMLCLIGLVILAVGILIMWPEKTYAPYQVDAEYQAQVDAFQFPPMPPDWTWKSFETADGTRLRWGETGNGDAARATVVWVPGYTASFEMYGEHTDILARNGHHVIGVDMRGQGGSERHRSEQPEKLWVEGFDVYANDLAAFLNSLPKREDRPVILAAISFGGHVGVRAAGDHDLPVDGLFLLAPAIRPQSTPYTFEEAKRLMNLSRAMGKSKHYVYGQSDWRPDGLDFTQGSDCSLNPKRLYLRDVLFTQDPSQRVGGITNQWGAEFFESSEFILKSGYLEAIGLPTTIISAANDTFVVTDYNSQACSDRFPNCLEVTPPGSGHCLLQESDAILGQIFDELDTLVERVKP